MSTLYLYIKAIHLIAAISWMVGLLYLPRLFAYHAEAGAGTPQAETFKRMERGLLRIIMNPAMIVTLVLGIWLGFFAAGGVWAAAGWLHAKIALVAVLVGVHMFLARWRRQFANDIIPRSPRFFRIVNEVPTVMLIGIVILATVKPF